MSDSLFSVIKNLRGNQRACIYTEPLWGLSMNLCIPYLSVYMLALGLSDTRIGFIVTMNTISQIIFSFLSGPITDKIGRRKATAIFDILAWCIPALIWWRAVNFWFFLAAAIINGANGVTANAWNCLLVEDADKKQITKLYTLVMVCSQMSAIFAPITSILISKLTLVPAIKILYVNGFILMAVKITILYTASKETSIGNLLMNEAKGKSIFRLAGGYGEIIKIIFKSKGMVFSIFVAVLTGTILMINNTFWQIIVNKKLLVPESALPFFMIFRSLLAIIFLFFVIPKITKGVLKMPLIMAFFIYMAGQGLLIMVPVGGMLKYPLLCLSLVFDGFGSGCLNMLSESLIALHIKPEERAGILAIRFMIMMIAAAPFGWIAGFLSDISRNMPFILSMVMLASGAIVTLIYYHRRDPSYSEH